MTETQNSLVNEIKSAARRLGFIDCGITTAAPFESFAAAIQERLRRFPEAANLYKDMVNRVDPRATAPWARSIIVCIRRYGKYKIPDGPADHIGRNYLADARLPDCPDYELPKRMTGALKDLGLRVKRGGVPDRLAAARSGAAQILRSGFAYHHEAGTWLNVYTWRVDAELPADPPARDCPCPENCLACLKNCPTNAIIDPYIMRMDRCVAYLTYYAPQPISRELWNKMGPWIYGCDVCQNVCPLNKGKWQKEEPAPWLDAVQDCLDPESLAEMDQITYRDKVHPLFWYIPVEDLERWHRNARRAAQFQA